MTLLFILNDAPYGSEKLYNALRLAMKLQQARTDAEVRVFLKEDTVTAAIPAQTTPQRYYNIERMLRSVLSKHGEIKICGTSVEARGIDKLGLIGGAEISTMSNWLSWSYTMARC